jgi:hypothetical protein
MRDIVYIVKVWTWDAMLGHILDASDRIMNSQLKLQPATRASHNWAAKCVAAVGGIFENLL